MNKDAGIAPLANKLATLAGPGIYEVLGDESTLDVAGSAHAALTVRDVQAAADAFADVDVRVRIQARLGLNPFAGYSQRDRNAIFAETFRTGRKYGSLSRADQNRPLRLLARQLVSDVRAVAESQSDVRRAVSAYDLWDVLEYQVDHSFPGAAGGPGVQIHKRLIRSNIEGLSQFRITQKVNWPSGRMPRYQMMSAGSLHIENKVATVEGGEPGFRFDLVIDIPALGLGDTLELKWIRTYEFAKTDLGHEGGGGSVDLSPITVVKHALIKVRFAADLVPDRIWKISGIPAIDRIQPPIVPDTLIPKFNSVSAEFTDVPVGYSVGVGWRW